MYEKIRGLLDSMGINYVEISGDGFDLDSRYSSYIGISEYSIRVSTSDGFDFLIDTQNETEAFFSLGRILGIVETTNKIRSNLNGIIDLIVKELKKGGYI